MSRKIFLMIALTSVTAFIQFANAQQMTTGTKKPVKQAVAKLQPSPTALAANLPAKVDVIDGLLKNLSPLLEPTPTWIVYKTLTYDIACPDSAMLEAARIESRFGEGERKTFSGTKNKERVTFKNTPCLASPELYLIPMCKADQLKENIPFDVNVEILASCKQANGISSNIVIPSKIQLIVKCDMRKGGIAKRTQLSWKHTCPAGYYIRESANGSFISEETSTTQGFSNPMICKKRPQ